MCEIEIESIYWATVLQNTVASELLTQNRIPTRRSVNDEGVLVEM